MPRRKDNIRAPCDESGRYIVTPNVTYAPKVKPLTRAKKEEINEVKADLKAQLPALTATGVRRYRLPHHESILLELNEAGFREAEDYLKWLYEYDDKSTKTETKKLKGQRHLTERIKCGLVNAELAKRRNDNIEQTVQMLEIALFFQSLTPEWFWIADKFFESALAISTTIVEDDGETLNIVKYIYGDFLFRKMKNVGPACTVLDEARIASEGKPWNASKILKSTQRNLFQEINLVLNEVLIALAEKLKGADLDLAVKTAIDAVERANDSGDENHLTRALYEAGKMQMYAGHINDAFQNFSKYLTQAESIPDPNGICNGHKELAAVYKVLKDFDAVKRHLILFKEHAEKSGLAARLADAHYYLGEFELEQGRPSSATPYLTFAFELYKKLEMRNEMDRARFLAGVSRGEELKTSYLEMIQKCKENDADACRKLLEWKLKRTPFWNI